MLSMRLLYAEASGAACRVRLPTVVFAVHVEELGPDIRTFTNWKEPRPVALTKVVKNDNKVPECAS